MEKLLPQPFMPVSAPRPSGGAEAMAFLQHGLITSFHLFLFHRIQTRISVLLYLLMSD